MKRIPLFARAHALYTTLFVITLIVHWYIGSSATRGAWYGFAISIGVGTLGWFLFHATADRWPKTRKEHLGPVLMMIAAPILGSAYGLRTAGLIHFSSVTYLTLVAVGFSLFVIGWFACDFTTSEQPESDNQTADSS